jgi:hypothetical protein
MGVSFATVTFVDDFTNVNNWNYQAANSNANNSIFSSNGNILRFDIETTVNGNFYTSYTSAVISVNVDSTHVVQADIPFLDFGDRDILLVINADSSAEEHLLHDQYNEIPGQLARLKTMDLATTTGWTGVKNIRFRLTMLDSNYGDATDAGRLDVDWIKITSGESTATPGSISTTTFLPLSGSTVNNLTPTLQWTAPSGFTNNLYTLTYGKDPLFRDGTVVTLRDSVVGTSYTFSSNLDDGATYYWTVSATDVNGVSGPFLQLPGVGDQRDPNNRVYPSFTVNTLSVMDWELY